MANFFDDATDTAAPTTSRNFFDDPPLAGTENVNGRLRITVGPKPLPVNGGSPGGSSEGKSAPDVGAGKAGVMGAVEGLSFGANPALVGLQKAGEAVTTPEQRNIMSGVPSEAPGMETMGAGIAGLASGDDAAKKAYDSGRSAAAEYAKLASDQHRGAYLAGLLGSAMILPTMGAGAGATVSQRMASGALAGGIYGGAYGGGSAIGEGASPAETAAQAATGAVLGAGGGAVIPPIAAGASAVGGAIKSGVGAALGHPIATVQAARNINETAARKVAAALRSDIQTGSAAAPSDMAAAQAAGQPTAIMDVGGTATRELAHSAANTSPEARSALETMTGERFKGQAQRVSDFVRGLVPTGGNAVRTQEAIDAAQRAANKPAYARAYRAGDRSIMSSELEQLTGSPDVVAAMKDAAQKGKSRAIAEGFGAFNHGVQVTDDGRVIFQQGKNGVPTYPNIQFWDYTYRSLRDSASAAFRAGRNDEGNTLSSLAKQLRGELDKQVPEYGAARGQAAEFFGAESALEAGQKFVGMRGSLEEARQAINKMSMPERAMFAEGFVSNLADKVSKIANNRSVTIDRIFNSVDGRERINLALGPNRAAQLEGFLRREDMLDLARKGLQGSTTARQQFMRALAGAVSSGHGAGGGLIMGGAAAGAEEFFSGEVDVKKVLGAAMLGAAATGKVVISRQLAQRVGELLASNDPADIQLVTRMAANNPVVRDSIRRGEIILEKLAGQGAGSASPKLLTTAPAAADQQQ